MRAILAGGGTGGHVIPALAIAQQLQKDYAAEVLFIGTARGIENRLVPAAGFPLRLVQVGALNRVSLTTRLKTFFDLPRAVWESRRMLAEFRPDVVIGVGGYASGPAMLAALLRRIPTLVFEPNFVPGFANRLVAPLVSGSGGALRRNRPLLSPLRSHRSAGPRGVSSRSPASVPQMPSRRCSSSAEARARTPSIRSCMESVAELAQPVPGIHIIHQTGERDYNDAQAAYANLGGSVEAHRFIDDMPSVFARADLLICRSGASTVAEVTAAGKPAIFVPFPRAADDHQKRNAEALERAGAAVMLEESKLNRDTPGRRRSVRYSAIRRGCRRMGEAARKLSHPNAARDIAAMAARLAGIKT